MGVILSILSSKRPLEVQVPETHPLNDNHIKIIIETWKIPSAKLIDSGEAILYRYFEKYPENQNKFVAFKNVPLLTLKGAPGFRTHASRIMSVFDAAIDCLDKENGLAEIERLWNEIGQSHNRRKITRQSFNELRDVIVEVLSEVCKLTEEQAEAWNILLDNIYHSVFSSLEQ